MDRSTTMANCLYYTSKLSFRAWNSNGLSSKSIGDKWQNIDFLNMSNNFDFIILSETWKCTDVEISGYRSVIQDAINSKKGGRNSGGIVLLYKNALHDWMSVVKKSPDEKITRFSMV